MISVVTSKITDKVKDYTVTITEKLCKPYCVISSVEPVVSVVYTIDETKFVNGVMYVTVKAQGTVTYVAKNGCPCEPCTKIFTEFFVVGFEGAKCTDCPTIKKLDGVTAPAYINCCNVACGISASSIVSVSLDGSSVCSGGDAPYFGEPAETKRK